MPAFAAGSDDNGSDTKPAFGLSTVTDKTYFQGESVAAETRPHATAGDGALTYRIAPPPPRGVRFDATTRVLSGLPTRIQDSATYSHTATDSDASDPDSASLTFAVAMDQPSVAATIAAAATEANEWEDQKPVAVTVTLGEMATTATTVTLRSMGTATLGSDFDFVETGSTPEITVAAGQNSATAMLRPIRDLDREGDETITLGIATIGGASPSTESGTVSIAIRDAGAPEEQVYDGAEVAALYGEMIPSITSDSIKFAVIIFNDGSKASSATKASLKIKTSFDATDGMAALPAEVDVPPMDPGGDFETSFTVSLGELQGGTNYYFDLIVNSISEEPEGEAGDGACGGPQAQRSCMDLHVATNGKVRTTCSGFHRTQSPGTADPLLTHQWALNNTGQTGFAESGGTAGEDFRMTNTLANGPTGAGVQVAVLDSGLEICHPDLAANVEPGVSHNFVAENWHGAQVTDPFYPKLTDGDHGTSVAGIIAAVANNGIGLRGVAPSARLRGFNVLESQGALNLDPGTVELAALGMSTASPKSDDVHIFNMSYGSGEGGANLRGDLLNAFRAGTEMLRPSADTGEALGALYVRAAGNSFSECSAESAEARENSLYLNNDVGCTNANLDPEQNIPYLIVIGAFDADGNRSVYSSVGANLWAVAPSDGDLGKPGILTTDQMGGDRGYVLQAEGLTAGHAENPHGDYIASFGGTSAAAPMASGAIALLLEAQPNLTWRDVKHIVAKTSRKLQADLPPVRVAFGGKPTILQHAWITNAAGYHFHNWFGFGAIDIDRAVAMARSITPNNLGVFAKSVTVRQTHNAAIPDHDGGGLTSLHRVRELRPGAAIEAVQLRVEITHEDPKELGFELISPSGTASVVNPVFNGAFDSWMGTDLDWTILTNAFYGEPTEGEWTLKVIDAKRGKSGVLKAWSLIFYTGVHR